MISQPMVILTVVATSDIDPVAAMQELTSMHHTPACFSNGQYDPSIIRIFVLLEDGSVRPKDALTVLRSLHAYFPPQSTKLLTINSLPVTNPNLHQPDMWSRYVIPKFFPQHAPSIDLTKVLPISPANQQPVLGCRLSGDDFMKLHDFCIWLYSEQVAPLLERRINILSNQVNENRKGMKNYFKSWVRKPRDESDYVKGGIKYRFDRIESQIMLLGDLSFMIKDYESAQSMYRLVKDDYRADKSNLHYAQVLLMNSICQIMSEPQKYKEIYQQVDMIGQCISAGLELPHAGAYLALVGSEIYTVHNNIRAPLESARLLLIASSSVSSKHPVLGSLLMERAALFYLQASQTRKYILHEVILGNRMMRTGPATSRHATVCFAAALMILERTGWVDLKAKLAKGLARDLKNKPGATEEDARRALLFLLKMLQTLLAEDSYLPKEESSLQEAVQMLQEIQAGGAWGNIRLRDWDKLDARDMVLSPLPFEPLEEGQSGVEVWGLPIPELNVSSVRLLQSINGLKTFDSDPMYTPVAKNMRKRLMTLFELEKRWSLTQSTAADNDADELVRLEDLWMKALHEEDREEAAFDSMNSSSNMLRVPLGEKLLLKATFKNKLPIDMTLSKAKAIAQPEDAFTMHEYREIIAAGESKDIFLSISPKTVGSYEVDSLGWNLSDQLTIRQSIQKKGPLLQRTMDQRTNRIRGVDTSLKFEVVPAQPWLELDFEGLSEEVLQGQLLKSILVMKNRGAAAASDIYLKLSEPAFVFCINDVVAKTRKVLDFVGKSYTLLHLKDMVIPPGKEVRLEAWMKVLRPGQQTIHVLAVYSPASLEGDCSSADRVTAPAITRSSFLSLKTCGLPSLGMVARWAGRANSANLGTLITEVSNYMSFVHDNDSNAAADADVDIRMSSVGQIDMMPSGDQQFAEVDENCFKVVSMLMIGAAHPVASSTASSSSVRPSLGIHISPTERHAQCFPVQASSSSSIGSGSTSWLPPPATALQEVMEQFLCLQYETASFDRDLYAAQDRLIEEELQVTEGRPRTIAEVRRDRQRQQQEILDEVVLVDIALDGVPTSASGESQGSGPYSPSGLRDGLQAIVQKEHRANTIGLSMLWVCRWQDKIRWGMHHVTSLRPGGAAKLLGNEGVKSLMESMVVAVRYVANDNSSGNSHVLLSEGQTNVTVEVVVELRSVISEPLLITVKAEDAASNCSRDESGSSSLIWQGKSRYDDQALPPRGTITRSFILLCLQPGVYNANQFFVRAKLARSGEELSGGIRDVHGFFAVPGQALVTVNRTNGNSI